MNSNTRNKSNGHFEDSYWGIEDETDYDTPVVVYRSRGLDGKVYIEMRTRWLNEDADLTEWLTGLSADLGFNGLKAEMITVSVDKPGYGYTYNWCITTRTKEGEIK